MSDPSESTTTHSTVESEEDPHAKAVLTLNRAMLRYALVPGAITVVLGAALAMLLVGVSGLFGALAGGAVAFVSGLMTIGLMRWTAGLHPMFVMVAMLAGYVGKAMILFVALTLLRGVDVLHPISFGGTMAATILVWAGAELQAFRKTKIPTIVPST